MYSEYSDAVLQASTLIKNIANSVRETLSGRLETFKFCKYLVKLRKSVSTRNSLQPIKLPQNGIHSNNKKAFKSNHSDILQESQDYEHIQFNQTKLNSNNLSENLFKKRACSGAAFGNQHKSFIQKFTPLICHPLKKNNLEDVIQID